MSNYLGIDLGTSSVKCLITDHKGQVVASSVRTYQVLTPQPMWHEQDPNDWLEALKKALRDIEKDDNQILQQVTSLAVTGQMHGIVPVNHNLEPIHHAIIWSDQRNKEELALIKESLSLEKWVELTGNRPNMSFTLGKILWFKKHFPELYRDTYKFLLPKDFIRLNLTGVLDTDESDASATLMMDLKTKDWSTEILELFQLDRDKLPNIVPSTHVSGTVIKEVSAHYSLKEGTPVICGCGDAQAQAIGNGIVNEKAWLCTIGTSGQLFVSSDELKTVKDGSVHTLAHGDSEKYVMMGATLSAGNSFKWFKEKVLDSTYDFGYLLDLASDIEPGAKKLIFLPYLNGERTPHMDENAKGTFIGLTSEHTKAEMARSIVEGVLFSLYEAYCLIQQRMESSPDYIVLTGGAAEHPVWLTTAANLFNLPIVRKNSRGGGAYGAAMLAAVGVNDFANLDDLSKQWGLQEIEEVFQPDSTKHSSYNQLFSIYQKCYQSLKSIYEELEHFGGISNDDNA
ncbi:xylulokinase [Bacillus sp. JJ1533]|uniref:xylulokinase n=2 Tax=Bacillales TaxID=1385 RepID=UPI002FFE48B7